MYKAIDEPDSNIYIVVLKADLYTYETVYKNITVSFLYHYRVDELSVNCLVNLNILYMYIQGSL